jgi:hypothetical protein
MGQLRAYCMASILQFSQVLTYCLRAWRVLTNYNKRIGRYQSYAV